MHQKGRWRHTFLDLTIRNAARVVKSIHQQADDSRKDTFLGRLSPQVKVLSFIYMIVIISLVSSIVSQTLITFFILLLYILARINIISVYRKIVFVICFFGLLVFLPAVLNVITPGKVIFNIFSFDKPHHFWIYHIPQHIGITWQGCRVVTLLMLRVLNSVSLTFLIVYSTPFPRLMKGFRIFYVPTTFIMVVSLAYKYILILSETVTETYMALKSRLIHPVRNKIVRRFVGGRLFFIFKRSRNLYEATYLAMVSRGYDGKINLIDNKGSTLSDIMAAIVVIAFGISVILIQSWYE
jgi:energy-coupling factor transporter transmembrane protein EcfT